MAETNVDLPSLRYLVKLLEDASLSEALKPDAYFPDPGALEPWQKNSAELDQYMSKHQEVKDFRQKYKEALEAYQKAAKGISEELQLTGKGIGKVVQRLESTERKNVDDVVNIFKGY